MCLADLAGIAANDDLKPIVVNARIRLQAQLLAGLNDSQAAQCGDGQEAVRETLRMNSDFLSAIAGLTP